MTDEVSQDAHLPSRQSSSDDLGPLAEKLALAGVALAAGRRDDVPDVLRGIRRDVDAALRSITEAEPMPGQTTIHDHLREAS